MKTMCIVFFAIAVFVAAEETKEAVVVAEEPKVEAVAVAEEPKEVRDMKALQQAYAFAIPYGYAASPAKFAVTPFGYGANFARFSATPYGNSFPTAPYYGYAAPYYGFGYPTFGATPVAFAAPAKFAAQTYPFGTAQPNQFESVQMYPIGAAKQQYATYAPQYAGYQNTFHGFPYNYGYAPNAYSFKFQDSSKDQPSSYLPENFPFVYPSYAFGGFPVTAKK